MARTRGGSPGARSMRLIIAAENPGAFVLAFEEIPCGAAGEHQHRGLLVERGQSRCSKRVAEFPDLCPLTPSHCGEGERGIAFR